MATPTLQDISIRLSTLDGINTAVPSHATVPVIQGDLNGLHTTLNQLVLNIQTQLSAVSSQIATLQVGLAGQSQDQAVRVGSTLLAAGALGGPYTVNFNQPYADGNYTVEVTLSLGEPISTAAVTMAGVQKQATPGNGVLVWVKNGDSVNHNITINVFVRHD